MCERKISNTAEHARLRSVNDNAARVLLLLRTQQGILSCPEMERGRTWHMNTLGLAGCASTASLAATRGAIYYSKCQPVSLTGLCSLNYQQ